MKQTIQAGDYVRLTCSTNPYVPVGTILHIKSESQIIDKSGRVQVFNVTHHGQKYIVHLEAIKKTSHIELERVSFT